MLYDHVISAPTWADFSYGTNFVANVAPKASSMIDIKSRGRGVLIILFLGGSVPPDPENPFPISDQNIHFSIPYFEPDSENAYPKLDVQNTGLCDAPSNERVFFLRHAMSVATHLLLKLPQMIQNTHPSSDQTGYMYTLSQTRNAWK